MAEVAARLRCPLKTAFSRLYAARRELRLELRRAGITGAFGWWWLLRPLRAQAASIAGFAATHAGAVSCAMTLVTLQVIGVESKLAKTEPMLLTETPAEVPRSTPWLPAPLPPIDAQVREPDRDARMSHPDSNATHPRTRSKVPVEHAPKAAPLPAATMARPESPARWIHAPAPVRTAPAREPAPPPVGLDEVTAVTSIKPLLRFGPTSAPSAQPFTLVTSHTRTR
jgi:hypothetical protein